MSLSPPGPRTPVHTRRIECQGFHREDGLWDIEAKLVDTRGHAMETFGRGVIEPGEHLHEMHIRMTVDAELTVTALEAKTLHAPYPACPSFPERFSKLVGERIAPGWTAKVRLLMGGKKGCTHLVELLGPVATTAVQTVYAWRSLQSEKTGVHIPPVELINTCHALAERGEAAKVLWPEAAHKAD